MRKRVLKSLLFLLIISAACAALVAGSTPVIVQLAGDAAAMEVARARSRGADLSEQEVEAYRNQLAAAQDAFLQQLDSRGISHQVSSVAVTGAGGTVSIPFRYTLVFNGIALIVEESEIASIEAMPEVRAVHPDSLFEVTLDNSVRYIRAHELYGGVAELTQFDDLREGFEGQGIYLSVIDTGIEWQHEMFGGDPSPPRLGVEPVTAASSGLHNRKVVYYLPLADLAVEDGYGHGTHVASTAAGYLGFAAGNDGLPLTEDDIPVHGVAPQAKLLSYAVCSDALSTVGALTGAVGGCLSSSIIMAIEDSVSPRTVNGFPKPVAHVINMSLGGPGSPDGATAIASDNAVRLGTIVVSSAGNSGPGEATVGSPAAGRHVIAVGASTDPGGGEAWSTDVLDPSAVDRESTGSVVPAASLPLAGGQRSNIRIFPMAGTPAPPSGSMAQYYVFVEGGELLVNWPATAGGRIALVRAGGPATFGQIAANGAAMGAEAVLFISTTETPTAVRGTIPGANVLPADARYLLDLVSGVPGVDPVNGAISNHPIRINPRFGTTFTGSMAGFSSRGPVAGFGQVKPDVVAPGVNVLAALPPASLLGILSGAPYGAISGTSMASPHVAGVAALIKQANPSWTPAMVRTALLNTATNLRDASGIAKADGIESINDQGSGLIDAFEAANARALMGVPGDGVELPEILGSHSFGAVPVINSRVLHTESVSVDILDVSGQGGSYQLRIVNNRGLEQPGISAYTSTSSVSVPAGGRASFEVSLSFDGDLIRSGPIQLQWYVIAEREEGGESLRMPFYYRAVDSVPTSAGLLRETYEGTVLIGDQNLHLVPGVSHVDIPFTVGEQTQALEATLTFPEIVDDTVADLDFYLLDSEGNEISSSTNPGGPEFIGVGVGSGNYIYRVSGWLNGPTDFTVVSDQILGGGPPTLETIPGDFTDSQGNSVDFDGRITLTWVPAGGEEAFEIEQSSDSENWQLIASLDGSQTQLQVDNLSDGTHSFRVRGLVAGEIGFYVTGPSNSESITVDRRILRNISSKIESSITRASLLDGIFEIDLVLTNESSDTFLPWLNFEIRKIESASGTVEVINADNGGDGRSKASRAVFDYSYELGSDDALTPGETSGSRTLRFADSAGELFTFKAKIFGHVSSDGASGGGSSAESGESGGAGAEGGASDPLDPGTLLEFTVNPLTGSISVVRIGL